MTVAELERRLTRMEGMLKMLVQAVAEGEDKDAAYRRGYQAGRAAALRRLDISPDEGLRACSWSQEDQEDGSMSDERLSERLSESESQVAREDEPATEKFTFGRPALHERGFTCCGKPVGCTMPLEGCAYRGARS